MRYFLVAGERSGDLHGANLIKAIHRHDPEAEIRCWGGEQMENAGAKLQVHYREVSFMGLTDVLAHLGTIRRYLKQAKQEITEYRPDVFVAIDFPAFNLRLAEHLKGQGIAVHYYISPKVWAWNTKRAHKIKRLVDRMYVIFPFEVGFYEQFDYTVHYVGNPLFDAIRAHSPNPTFMQKHQLGSKPVVAVLPGSRRQEIARILNPMLDVVDRFPEYEFVVAGVDNLPASYYKAAEQHPKVKVVLNETYDLLSHAHAALVTSGTATLETALFNVPQVVLYRTSGLTYAMAKRVIKVPYISLVNLVTDAPVVKELIQADMNEETIGRELHRVAAEGQGRSQVFTNYQSLRQRLGDHPASDTTARQIVEWVKARKKQKE